MVFLFAYIVKCVFLSLMVFHIHLLVFFPNSNSTGPFPPVLSLEIGIRTNFTSFQELSHF